MFGRGVVFLPLVPGQHVKRFGSRSQMRNTAVSAVAERRSYLSQSRTRSPKQRSSRRSVQTLTKEDVPLAGGDDLLPVWKHIIVFWIIYCEMSHLQRSQAPSLSRGIPLMSRRRLPPKKTMEQMPPPPPPLQTTCYNAGCWWRRRWCERRGWRSPSCVVWKLVPSRRDARKKWAVAPSDKCLQSGNDVSGSYLLILVDASLWRLSSLSATWARIGQGRHVVRSSV